MSAAVEGWACPTMTSRAHYFRDGRSLCGKARYVGPVAGNLEEATPDDCALCGRIGDREVAAWYESNPGIDGPSYAETHDDGRVRKP